jgi:hypothetical protein
VGKKTRTSIPHVLRDQSLRRAHIGSIAAIVAIVTGHCTTFVRFAATVGGGNRGGGSLRGRV